MRLNLPSRAVTFALRTPRAGNQSLIKEIAAAVQAVSPNLPLAEVWTLEDACHKSMARTSFIVILLGIAAAMAVTIALIGVYGIQACAVAGRRHEIRIRLALAAAPTAVRAMFLRQGLLLAALGGTLGLTAAAALSKWITTLLYGVKPLAPLTYALAPAALTAAALLATYLPARRAATINPIDTLRGD
jgi:ABC-type antimicrobial peptide transport system permease subunit